MRYRVDPLALLISLLTGTMLAAAPPPTTPSPSTQPVRRLNLTGTITSPTPITRLVAVDRSLADPLAVTKDSPQTPTKDPFVYTGQIDPKTGIFTIPNLLSGPPYDLIVYNAAGRWEGLNMDYHRLILPDKPFTPADKEWIENFVATEPQFTNKARVLWIAADHKHATLAVELIRDTDFHSGGSGDIIYRIELWYFERLFGGWAKDKNTERVLLRWRGPGNEFPPPAATNWQFVPQLGGLTIPTTGILPPLTVKLPEPTKKHGVARKL